MNIAVCDDSSDERKNVIAAAMNFFSSKNIPVCFYEFDCGEKICDSNVELLSSLDLIFLDIYMSKLNGINTARRLREIGISAPIVFLTATCDFAVESYEVSALSYIIKPLCNKKFEAVMERFLITYRPKSIFIDGRLFIEDDIVFAESEGRAVTFHFKDGSSAKINAKLDNVESQLSKMKFMRSHQSFIVNFNYVTEVSDGSFLTTLGLPVMIRRRDFPAIKKAYFRYIIDYGVAL